MDKMVNLFKGIYKDKNVFVTGHTGFKGSWLVYWLQLLGANVKGYSLSPNTNPSHWELLDLDIESVYNNILNQSDLEQEINSFKPDIIFHLAAQPLVKLSYDDPVGTFETNVMGTLKLYEAARKQPSIKAIVNITSDKCYANKEWVYGYREEDAMGGYDPYSASKGCAELLTDSYRNSYWNIDTYGSEHQTLIASCRAGNVIGGGDWGDNRLIPDMIKSVVNGKKVEIRNPSATRPWQHVLDPLSGYLLVGQELLEGKKEVATGWNFGPTSEKSVTVGEVVAIMQSQWSAIEFELDKNHHAHEANLLKLDCSKAHHFLNWKPIWSDDEVFQHTANWYKAFVNDKEILTEQQIIDFVNSASNKNLAWTQ